VAVLLLATLVTAVRINFDHSRAFTANQSYSNAKNVANVLALSLGAHLAAEAFLRASINDDLCLHQG